MTDIYFKGEGVQYSAEEYFKTNLKNYIDVLNITKKYLCEKLKVEYQPTEINFVKYPHLGDELFKDDRIVSDKLNETKEDFNQIGGVAIYIKDEQDQNQILMEGYRNLRISYISIIEHYSIIQNALGAIHELNHFRDPFNTSVNFITKFFEKGYEQDTKLFIQHNVRNILNEYYANYRSYKYLKSILLILNLLEFDIIGILNESLFNLKNSLELFKEQLVSLKKMEENYQRFNQYLSICFKLFETIFKLLGKWHGLKKDFKDIDKVFIIIWEKYKRQIDVEFIISYLDLIESTINPNFKKEGNIEGFYNLFYYLESEYPRVLNSLNV